MRGQPRTPSHLCPVTCDRCETIVWREPWPPHLPDFLCEGCVDGTTRGVHGTISFGRSRLRDGDPGCPAERVVDVYERGGQIGELVRVGRDWQADAGLVERFGDLSFPRLAEMKGALRRAAKRLREGRALPRY